MTATLASIPIPSSYKQSMEHVCWQQAIETELLALEENQMSDVVPSVMKGAPGARPSAGVAPSGRCA